jgi:hypothetical protein
MNVADKAQELEVFAPDAPATVLQLAVRHATRRFMRDTLIARDTSEATTQKCVREYLLNLPECREVVQIFTVSVAGRPQAFHIDGPNLAIAFDRDPQPDAPLVVDYAWSVGPDACEAPDFVYVEGDDALRFAALAYLHLMPGQEWSSAERHQYFQAAYDMERSKARTRAAIGYGSGRIRMRGAGFGFSSRTTASFSRG